METDMDHFSFNDTMYHNLARSLEVLGSITCAEISFGNAKSWKQRFHIGFCILLLLVLPWLPYKLHALSHIKERFVRRWHHRSQMELHSESTHPRLYRTTATFCLVRRSRVVVAAFTFL